VGVVIALVVTEDACVILGRTTPVFAVDCADFILWMKASASGLRVGLFSIS